MVNALTFGRPAVVERGIQGVLGVGVSNVGLEGYAKLGWIGCGHWIIVGLSNCSSGCHFEEEPPWQEQQKHRCCHALISDCVLDLCEIFFCDTEGVISGFR